jgi:hypothetical protein
MIQEEEELLGTQNQENKEGGVGSKTQKKS